MREYTLRQTGNDEWELRHAESADCDGLCIDPLYRGHMLGAAELLTYLEESSTPQWAAHVAAWEDDVIESFLRRLAVRPPARKIDRLKRVVTLIAEGEHPRPLGVQ